MSNNNPNPDMNEAPAVELDQMKKNWLNIAKGVRNKQDGVGKNVLPVSKVKAQWKSFKDTDYAFHQIRKFIEAMLKAGDNIGEYYTVTPEVVVNVLLMANNTDMISSFENFLDTITDCVVEYVKSQTPSELVADSEKDSEESLLISKLRAAKKNGDKALAKKLMAEYTSKFS